VQPWLVVVIVVPSILVVIALFLVMWRERTSDQTTRVAVASGIVLLGWLVGTSILGLRGFYFPPVSGPPPVGVQLTVALIGLALSLVVAGASQPAHESEEPRRRGVRGPDVQRKTEREIPVVVLDPVR
jgi:membrane associated rhomboid family serine protease